MTTPESFANERSAAITFTATPWGYTKLWLVNMLLTLATLGIYGAWAKVRNNQYLYGHTSIEDHRLQYLATPKQILLGRLLALGVFLIFVGVSMVEPMAAGIMYLALIPLSPWLIVQGLKFTYRNTAYRNVRFDFKGDYMGALYHFILLPLLAAVTLYLALPWVIRKIHQFMFGNCEYGGEKLQLNTSTGQYYKAALVVFLVSIVAFVLIASSMAGTLTTMQGSEAPNPLSFLPIILVMYFFSFLVQSIFTAMIRNHIAESLKADELVRFESRITVAGYLGITMLNSMLILFTLGLAFPAAKVIKMRYIASKTTVYLTPRIDHMANQVEGKESAFGEEAAGMFDTDLSIV